MIFSGGSLRHFEISLGSGEFQVDEGEIHRHN